MSNIGRRNTRIHDDKKRRGHWLVNTTNRKATMGERRLGSSPLYLTTRKKTEENGLGPTDQVTGTNNEIKKTS